MKIKKVIPIYFASDINYVPYLTVAIKSLVEHTSNKYFYKIYILSADLTDADITEIKSYQRHNVLINIVDVKLKMESIKNKVALRDYYSVSIYFRLFIPTLFPEYDKAIYLDSDIVVNKDIAELYNHEIWNNYVGAVLDEVVYTNKDFIYYINNALDVNEKQYFNSGVLIMNLKKFRDDNIEEDFYNWVNKYCLKFGSVAPDQDYLNCICKNKVRYLSQSWNKMPLGEEFPSSKLGIIHYNMFLKPWKYKGTMFESYFWNVAKTTSFYNRILEFRENYSDEKKLKDKIGAENLIKLALNIANSDNNYRAVVLKKPKNLNNNPVSTSDMIQESFEDLGFNVGELKNKSKN